MLRFIKHQLTSIENVEIFPIITLILFSSIFLFACYRIIRMKKAEVEYLSNIPLDKED